MKKVETVKRFNPTGNKTGQVLNTNADYVRCFTQKMRAILTT